MTPTGIARDWIRRYAWRRIGELWAANDPEGPVLSPEVALEFEARRRRARSPHGTDAAAGQVADRGGRRRRAHAERPTAAPGRCRSASPSRASSLGPANEFAHAVARRVASWADGHFNPVVFHGPYGFGKTHLLNAIAWEAMTTGARAEGRLPDRRAVPVDLRARADGAHARRPSRTSCARPTCC